MSLRAAAREDLVVARECLRSFLRGEDSAEADVGGEVVAEFMLVVTGFLTKK